MDNKFKLRRFRFSLLALFGVVTVLSMPLGWMAYSLNWIRQRHAIKASSSILTGVSIDFGYWRVESSHSQLSLDKQAPGLLWLFGEEGVNIIYLTHGPSDRDVDHLKSLFPEAIFVDERNPMDGHSTAPTP